MFDSPLQIDPADPLQDMHPFPHSKAELRHELISLRRSLPEDTALALSERIQARVLDLPAWREARMVALYVAVRREVSTERLLDAAWKDDKTVLLPRCRPRNTGKASWNSRPAAVGKRLFQLPSACLNPTIPVRQSVSRPT